MDEQKENSGRIDILEITLLRKQMDMLDKENDYVEIKREELQEIITQLREFRSILANMFLHENSLKDGGYEGLIKIAKEKEHYYRNK